MVSDARAGWTAGIDRTRFGEKAMDGPRFDLFTRFVGEASSRRAALSMALGGATAATIAAVGLATGAGESEAKKKKKRKKKKKKCPVCQPFAADAPCSTNQQCCTNETNRACATPENASNSDKTCCGSTGATCGGRDGNLDTLAPFCCAGFSCSSNTTTPGTCQPGSPL
jgi:hypothetical protein